MRQDVEMRRLVALAAVLGAGVVVACGARTGLLVPDDGGAQHDASGENDATTDGPGHYDGSFLDAPFVQLCMDAGGADAAVPDATATDAGCDNLECRVVSCGGGAHTTLSGRVLDPAGATPLYDVLVYIPNRPLDPMPSGVVCSSCQAPASGRPIRATVTDTGGAFQLVDVPTGPDVPIVVQLGKWRRVATVPQVSPCADNPVDPSTTRLPSKTSEGDMPLIAFTTGCDPAECFLRHIGIDDSEFVPPDSPTGHVHLYVGQAGGESGFSNVAGGGTVAQTYQWWTDPANLLQYDIVFDACECTPFDRNSMGGTGDAYQAMDEYLKAGGRLFATHYYGNWFFDPGTPDLRSTTQWAEPPWSGTSGGGFENDFIDQSFPKGQAYAQWLLANGVSLTLGSISLVDTRDDVVGQAPPRCSTASGTCLDTQWIVHPGDSHPRYLSFNIPVGAPAGSQCGRAVFSDVHLSGSSDSSQFPNECANADPNGAYRLNEEALEFLFFDLSSCIQDDGQPPQQPCAR